MMRRRTPRPPSALRGYEKAFLRLSRKKAPELDLSNVRKEVDAMIGKVAATTAAAAKPALDSYVDTYVAEWLARMKAHHDEVVAELDVLGGQVAGIEELYRTHLSDLDDIVGDLQRAVSHALERVSDPDTPYYEPIPRRQRKRGDG